MNIGATRAVLDILENIPFSKNLLMRKDKGSDTTFLIFLRIKVATQLGLVLLPLFSVPMTSLTSSDIVGAMRNVLPPFLDSYLAFVLLLKQMNN